MMDELINIQRVERFKQSRFNPIRQLTPERLAQWLDSFEYGDLREFALLADVVAKRDDILSTVIPKRVGAIARRRVEIITVDGLDESQRGDAEKHRDALSYFYNNLRTCDAIDRDQRGGIGLLIRQMLRGALSVKYAIHEIQWQPSPAGITAKFQFVPLWFFENRTGQLRFLKNESDYTGAAFEPDRFMVTTGPGLMMASVVAFVFKRMSLMDWVDYNERFGTPLPVGKTDAAPDSAEWKALVEAVRSIGRDWAAVMSRSSEITGLDIKVSGQAPFAELHEAMNRALTRIWRGADLGTMSADRGQGQGASLQADESFLIESDDADIITETLNEYIDRFVIRYTFGDDVQPLAYAKVVVPERKDVAQERATDEFLVKAGVRLSIADTLERYSRTEADGDEPVLGITETQGQVTPGTPTPQKGETPDLPPDEEPAGANERRMMRSGELKRFKMAGRPPHFAAVGDKKEATSSKSTPKGLVGNSVDLFASSVAADLAPVRRRLQAISDIQDPEIQRTRLIGFLAEFETLKQSILADPESSLALSKIQAAGVLGGLLQKV